MVSDRLLEELRQDIAFRRIDNGIQLLRSNQELIDSCGPKQRNGAIFLGYLAQSVDIGFSHSKLVKTLLARFPEASRMTLPVRDFVHLQMAEGLVALCDQEDEKAIRHFEMVLAIPREVEDQELITIANFWIGRCYRRQGRYQDALGYVIKAREAASRLGHFKTVAVIQVLEGWILFQEGKTHDAAKMLSTAEEVLLETDDYVARGNLNSTYGRIARRNGDYDEALRRFEIAIQEYKKRDEQHRNLARSLVNIAFVKRLLALELSDRLDSESARTRKTHAKKQTCDGFSKQPCREHFTRLREEASQHLIEAGAIYSLYHDYRGEGNVQVTYGYLHLDYGNLDLATARVAAAYRLGDDKKDSVLRARSRILQSQIENAKIEEQIGDRLTSHRASRLSLEYAQEAVECAKTTQNRRLMATAYVTLGLALSNDGEVDAARECSEQAATLLKPENHDYVWREFQTLKDNLRRAGTIDSTLREWSRGSVRNKTFQQITEEFAAIVIPKVWRREGCKISRVASRLSISPKKVRRILRAQGISTGTH